MPGYQITTIISKTTTIKSLLMYITVKLFLLRLGLGDMILAVVAGLVLGEDEAAGAESLITIM